jgi:hypothetical protein
VAPSILSQHHQSDGQDGEQIDSFQPARQAQPFMSVAQTTNMFSNSADHWTTSAFRTAWASTMNADTVGSSSLPVTERRYLIGPTDIIEAIGMAEEDNVLSNDRSLPHHGKENEIIPRGITIVSDVEEVPSAGRKYEMIEDSEDEEENAEKEEMDFDAEVESALNCGKTPNRFPNNNKSKACDDRRGKYPCVHPGCNKVFERRYNLKVHGRRHSGETPYSCRVRGCMRKFKWRSSMAHHNKSHERLGQISRHMPIVQDKNIGTHKHRFRKPEIENILVSALNTNVRDIIAVSSVDDSSPVVSSGFPNLTVDVASSEGNHLKSGDNSQTTSPRRNIERNHSMVSLKRTYPALGIKDDEKKPCEVMFSPVSAVCATFSKVMTNSSPPDSPESIAVSGEEFPAFSRRNGRTAFYSDAKNTTLTEDDLQQLNGFPQESSFLASMWQEQSDAELHRSNLDATLLLRGIHSFGTSANAIDIVSTPAKSEKTNKTDLDAMEYIGAEDVDPLGVVHSCDSAEYLAWKSFRPDACLSSGDAGFQAPDDLF